MKVKPPRLRSNEELLGFSYPKERAYGINLSAIWNKTRTTDKFIKRFSQIVLHEQVHILIKQLIKNKKRTDYGEEVAVRKLCSEHFLNTEKEFYR